jgi:hypothetical protein
MRSEELIEALARGIGRNGDRYGEVSSFEFQV